MSPFAIGIEEKALKKEPGVIVLLLVFDPPLSTYGFLAASEL